MPTDRIAMLVDDNPIDLKVNSRLLEIKGLVTKTLLFSTVDAGIEALKSRAASPDFILLDIQMPIKNGFDFIEAYRQLPASITDRIQLFMLSTTMHTEDKERAAQFPEVKALLLKPLQYEELEKLIHS